MIHERDDDKLHEECGVFGVWNHADAAALVALGLHALQHRGQESTGIVTYDGERFHSHRGLGLVGENFSDARVMAGLPPARMSGTPKPGGPAKGAAARATPPCADVGLASCANS